MAGFGFRAGTGRGDTTVPIRKVATAADLGLSRKEIHEARAIRDAENREARMTFCDGANVVIVPSDRD